MLPRIAFIFIFTHICFVRLPYGLAIIFCVLLWLVCITFKPKDHTNPVYCIIFLYLIYAALFNPPVSTQHKMLSPLQFGVSKKQRTHHCPENIAQKEYWNVYGCTLIFGDQNRLPSDLKRSLQKIGMSHILAISGLHFGVMYFTFKVILQVLFGFFSLFINRKIPPNILYIIKSFLLILICIYYYRLTNLSPASFRACSLLVLIEIFKAIGFRVKFLDLLVSVFIFTAVALGNELLSTGNILSWSCYIIVIYFHKKNGNSFLKNIYMHSCFTLIGASFFMSFNLLSPFINMAFLPSFILLFSGLILTFIMMNIFNLSIETSTYIVKHLENYFILLDEWAFYSFRHFQINIHSPTLEALLPFLSISVLGYFCYRLETAPSRTLIRQ